MMSSKKILVILTNESFLPHDGHGSRSYAQVVSPAASTSYAPSTWQSPLTATHGPRRHEEADPAAFSAKHRPTGVDILEVGSLWFKLADSEKWDLTFASPRGGAVAIDPMSIRAMDKTMADRIWHEGALMCKLNHTYPLAWIRAEEYDAVIIPGAHAAMLDLPHCKTVSRAIAEVWEEAGCVAAIGHGVAALLNVRCDGHEDDGHDDSGSDDSTSEDEDDDHHGGKTPRHHRRRHQYLVHDKRIACFTKEEEEKSHLQPFLPYSLEGALRKRGAHLQTTKAFQPQVVVEECERSGKTLITAQSYPSIHTFIDRLVETVGRKPRR